jgi:hypothetical protein
MSEWKTRVGVLLAYVGLALVYAWPLPAHLGEEVVLARGADFYPHVWNLWWMRFSLLDLHQNPYLTDYVHFPTGLPLVYHVLDPLNGLLSIPLQWAFGLLAAFNMLRLAHLVFTGVATYALCRVLGLPAWAAWVGGALFMACPVASVSFDLGQLVEISTGWLPLYVLCLIRALGNGALGIAPGGWGWIAGAGLSLAAAFLATPYFFIALVLFTLVYVVWEGVGLVRRKTTATGYGLRATGYETKDQEPALSDVNGQGTAIAQPAARSPQPAGHSALIWLLARAAAIGALAVLVLSPLLVAILGTRDEDTDLASPLRTVVANSADLLSPFLPAPARLQFPSFNTHGGTAALGWSVILLAGVGLLAWTKDEGRKTKDEELTVKSSPQPAAGSSQPNPHAASRGHLWFWLVVAVAFTLLSFGPRLLVAGNDTGVPMPFALLSQVPFLGLARVPLRFILIASLALSVLAAFGLVALSGAIKEGRIRSLALGLAGVLLAIELLAIPRVLFTPQIHPFWNSVATNGGEGREEGVLEVPQGPRTAPAMYVQTRHQHPIVAGYTARHYPYPWLDATPGVSQLVHGNPDELSVTDIISPPVKDTALEALDYYGVRYVALYATDKPDLDERAGAAAELIFGPANVAPTFADDMLTVWRVPGQSYEGPFVGLGNGWYGVEGIGSEGERRWRWTNGDAYVQVTNPTPGDMAVAITLAAYTAAEPRTLVVSLDGEEQSRHTVGPHPAQTLTLYSTLTPGEHWLRLRSVEPAERPPGDSRALSIGYEQIAVDRR